jgi:hypothetical protein
VWVVLARDRLPVGGCSVFPLFLRLSTNIPVWPACRKSLEEVGRLFGSGELNVNISHRFSLEQAPEAFSIMMNRQVHGVTVLPCGRKGRSCQLSRLVPLGCRQLAVCLGINAAVGRTRPFRPPIHFALAWLSRPLLLQVIGKILLLPQPRSML